MIDVIDCAETFCAGGEPPGPPFFSFFRLRRALFFSLCVLIFTRERRTSGPEIYISITLSALVPALVCSAAVSQ